MLLWFTSLLCVGMCPLVAEGSHFRGGIIMLRPNQATSGNLTADSVSMELSFHISWRRSSAEGARCTDDTITQKGLIGSGNLVCQQGCSGTVTDLRYHCTDFSEEEDWTYGERTVNHTFKVTNQSNVVKLAFTGGDWIMGGSWSIPVTTSLQVRRDTGRINSTPRAISSPVVRLRAGCKHKFKVPVSDPDRGDQVRCRWASGRDECGAVCGRFPGAELDEETCAIAYESHVSDAGYRVVALMIEDYKPNESNFSTPLSSVALQFLVLFVAPPPVEDQKDGAYCFTQPQFVSPPTPREGQCLGIPAGQVYKGQLAATTGADKGILEITEFQTVSPPGLRKGPTTESSAGVEYTSNLTWTPTQEQEGLVHLFCASAVNSAKESSDQRCVKFMPGVDPPKLLSVVPAGPTALAEPRNPTWTLKFDKPVQLPTSQGFIKFYHVEENNRTWLECDTSDKEASEWGWHLIPSKEDPSVMNFTILDEYHLPEKSRMFALLDVGVVSGMEGCGPASEPMNDPTTWTFVVRDRTPPYLNFDSDPVNAVSNGTIRITWTSSDYDPELFSSKCALIEESPDSFEKQTKKVPCLGEAQLSTTGEWKESGLPEGKLQLLVTATDAVGNAANHSFFFTVDRTPPELSLVSSTPKFSSVTKSNFISVSCNEAAKLQVRFYESNTKQLVLDTKSYDTKAGYHTYYGTPCCQEHGKEYTIEVFNVTDEAGNVGENFKISFTVDLEPPVIKVDESAIADCSRRGDSLVAWPNITDALSGIRNNATYTDTYEQCTIIRKYLVYDVAGNRGEAEQLIRIDPDVDIEMVPRVLLTCDSSKSDKNLIVPEVSAKAVPKCFRNQVPVELQTTETVRNREYPCPGTFLRIHMATNNCSTDIAEEIQTYEIVDICPPSSCGRLESPPRGMCVLGKCSCFEPWQGDNCQTKVFKPIIKQIPDRVLQEAEDYEEYPSLVQGDKHNESVISLLSWRLTNTPKRLEIDLLSGAISWKRADAGNYSLEIIAENAVGSAKVTWRVIVLPTYSAVLDQVASVLPSATVVSLSGRVIFEDKSHIQKLLSSAVPISILVNKTNGGATSEISGFSRTDGSFVLPFSPVYSEYGHYTAAAVHPSYLKEQRRSAQIIPQVSWDFLGMRAEPKSASLSGEARGQLVHDFSNVTFIINDGPQDLSQVTAMVLSRDSYKERGLEVNVTIDGRRSVPFLTVGSSAGISLRVSCPAGISAQFNVEVRSQRGTKTVFTVSLEVKEIAPVFEAEPKILTLSALRGGPVKDVKVKITNKGKASASNLAVRLPKNDLISVSGLSTRSDDGDLQTGVSDLKSTDAMEVNLQVSIPLGQELGLISGSFLVSSNETALEVPFKITVVSNLKVDFTVKVEDEYTYFAKGTPLVKNAKVRLLNYRTGVDLTEGTARGPVTFHDIIEDRYELYVEAPKHRSVKHVVIVSNTDDGRERTVFLERLGVTYTWSVTPVQYEDKYDITIEADFETRVPMPVVTVQPNDIDLEPYELGYKDTINFNVTNHGLIRADNVSISLPLGHPFLAFEGPEDLGSLDAQTSIIVPVSVKRKERVKRVAWVWVLYAAEIIYKYVCGEWQTRSSPIAMRRKEPSSSVSGLSYGPSGGGGYWGGGGRAWGWGDYHFDGFSATTPQFCSKCVEKMFCLAPKPKFPGAGKIPELASGPPKSPDPDFVSYAVNHIRKRSPKPVQEMWDKLDTLQCITEIVGECLGEDGGGGSRRRRRSAGQKELTPDLVEGLYPVMLSIEAALEMLGDRKWVFDTEDPTWVDTILKPALSDTGDMGYLISPAEQSVILQARLPDNVTVDETEKLLERLNSSMYSWNAGILEPDNSTGLNIASYKKIEAWLTDIYNFNEKAKDKGFKSYTEAYNHAAAELDKLESWEEESGVCAVVRIRLKQQVAITREAFLAALDIENKESNPLENVTVALYIRDARDGVNATDKFSLGSPTLTGSMKAVSSEFWTLDDGQTGGLEWLLVPYSEAAPTEDVFYDVGGKLTYSVGGDLIEITLQPSRITVKPDPSLRVHYFWEKYVQGDDPFTDGTIEPSQPFSLGVAIKNAGYGIAHDVRISSSQPEIVENEKGLLVNFKLIGSSLGSQPRQPSLSLELGSLGTNETAVVRWWMTCSLEGTFKNYSATFENTNPLGDEKLSVLDELAVHELIHNVMLMNQGPGKEDSVLDFLVNDRKDIDFVPDAVYDSATLQPRAVFLGQVTQVSESTIVLNSSITMKELTVTVISNQTGWNFFSTSDISVNERLMNVFPPGVAGFNRTSPKTSQLPKDNAWLRKETSGKPRRTRFHLNLFDWADGASIEAHYKIWICMEVDCTQLTQPSGAKLQDPDRFITVDQNRTLTLTATASNSSLDSNLLVLLLMTVSWCKLYLMHT